MSDEPKGDSLESGVSKWNSIVPELYFDLISRVPAGTVLVLGLIWAYIYPRDEIAFLNTIKEMGWAGTIVLLILLLGAGHWVGILLTPCGLGVRYLFVHLIEPKIYNRNSDLILYVHNRFKMKLSMKRKSDNTIKPLDFAEIEKDKEDEYEYDLTANEAMRLYRIINEFLKNEDAQARLILPKMQAEAALGDNLAPAIFVSFFIFILRNHWAAVSWLVISIVIFAIALSIFASLYRHGAEIRRQFAFLRIVKHREDRMNQSRNKRASK